MTAGAKHLTPAAESQDLRAVGSVRPVCDNEVSPGCQQAAAALADVDQGTMPSRSGCVAGHCGPVIKRSSPYMPDDTNVKPSRSTTRPT